jgi:hypothetical protein
MKSFILSAVSVVLSLSASGARANDFCRGGVHADGVVDLSAAPANSTAPYTVPVLGVHDLTATITYKFGLNGATITFSKPVKGLTVRLASVIDYQSASYTVTVARAVSQSFPSNSDFLIATDGTVSGHTESTPPVLDAQATTGNFSVLSPATDILSITFDEITELGPQFLFVRNLRVQSGDVDLANLVPRRGLKMWLGNQITLGNIPANAPGPGLKSVTEWIDLSGNGNNAEQTIAANQPTAYYAPNSAGGFSESGVIGDGPTCQPAVNFNGQGQFLNFNLPIEGLSDVTIFLVAAPDADGTGGPGRSQSAAIFWNESEAWGSTHLTPFQTIVSARFGTTQLNDNLVYVRPVDTGADYTVTTFEKRDSTDSLWVDGEYVAKQDNQRPQLSGVLRNGFLGQGSSKTYWKGEIAEVLVYDRALDSTERKAVEHYLMSKHFDTRR